MYAALITPLVVVGRCKRCDLVVVNGWEVTRNRLKGAEFCCDGAQVTRLEVGLSRWSWFLSGVDAMVWEAKMVIARFSAKELGPIEFLGKDYQNNGKII
ncbi:hypothetical protein SLEP1_g20341 [Rubroshorea leprosula]|uniref:Uncharacterized protein n=1 Tax=Rubroshorea leprosula TaxID=152421 RepID=A0AAV5J2D3_9ROSI|nr:hypothetical protein SLEP1_g20341 [Rubroshorea leprosula]